MSDELITRNEVSIHDEYLFIQLKTDLQKRPTCMKRDLFIHMKRDLQTCSGTSHISKETYMDVRQVDHKE